jgi:S1-C subfamily serine protease
MRALIAALLGATILAGCSSIDRTAPTVDVYSPNVRIETPEGGVGSGVHIGNGLIITAAHVVGQNPTVKVKADVGGSQDATVLWVNAAYDIAAIRPARAKKFRAAPLSCRSPDIGEVVSAWGNPGGFEEVTMHGYVSGAERAAGPQWKSVFLTDMTTIGGMSGGPTYDAYGDVVGITVGTVGFGAPSGGLGFVVPGSVVCELLGRV